ncbi:MAG: TylF/MycF/NovP-related O-methyltransferase [Burkholderiales bacterium]
MTPPAEHPLPKLSPADPNRLAQFFVPMFWAARDPAQLLRLAEAMTQVVEPGYHFGDNLFTWARNNSMLDDHAFVAAWQANVETDADRAIVWRRYVLACAGYHAIHLDGDFVECGAYTGVGIKTVVDYLGGAAFPKRFWAYDLFVHDERMPHHAMPDHGPELEARVRHRFHAYPQVKIFAGRIPEVLRGQSPERIAYLHIDLNNADGEVAALEALFDRVVPGGLVILDDYEWSLYRPQKLAEDAWFDAREYRVMPLPTGQGLVIKR